MTISKVAAAVRARAGVFVRDGFGLAGAASVAYGAWLIYPPAGFIVGGLFLMAGAFLTAKAKA